MFKSKKGEFFLVLVVIFIVALFFFVTTYPMIQEIIEPLIPGIMSVSPIAGICILFFPMWLVFWLAIKIFFGSN